MTEAPSLASLAAAARETYLSFFAGMVEATVEPGVEGMSEVGVDLEDPGFLGGLYRFDLVLRLPDDRAVSLDFAMEVPHGQDLPAFAERVGALTLHVFRLRWDDVVVHHDLGDLPEDALEGWFERWFNVHEPEGEDDPFPADRLHSASVATGAVSVDFGTAPSAALVELVSLLEARGAKAVQIDASRDDAETDPDDETVEDVELDEDESLLDIVRRRGPLLN
ncbi:hypothetical protein [Albimonas pacifica]|uniref:Uncharacterized protein n=1 Tax=Albimonas pacifica TaxID=1114924 RepID=A0A1I3ISU0_9RHOB|nr:hypothetical protein [Albimonas pacifica]SFI50972.1 hypothetical protein SAMN05216258_107205 [Albimonas pacifica]